MQPVIYYCYDAYCGWCYGFSPVIKQIANEYIDKLSFEVLSGGMIPSENPRPIAAIASYINDGYKRVQEMTGVKFGEEYLWHIRNADKSDWHPHSEKAAIALCIFKEQYPQQQVAFAADLQYSLYYEGRDLTDNEAYRHLLEQYSINTDDFYSKLKSEEYKDKALYEFSFCRQLQVVSFPQVLIQVSEQKFHLIANGYTDYDTMQKRIESVIDEIKSASV